MSTGMRCTARSAHSAMATRATTMVIGLLRAANTRRMFAYSSIAARQAMGLSYQWDRSMTGLFPRPETRASFASLGDKRLNIPRGRRDSQQPAPNTEAGECVVDFGLGKQALGLGDLIDGAETGLVAGRGLLGSRARGRYLDG